MRTKSLFILCSFSLLLAGCYFPITGRVVDVETNKPIEGAVVLVEWTKTHGIGDHATESYKVVEVLSDKDGKIVINGCYSPFVDPPSFTVYKRGYVAWNSEYIFPGNGTRKDFKWKDQLIQLEHFQPGYSFIDHTSFIGSAIRSSMGIKQIFKDAYYWEELQASDERNKMGVR